MKKAKSNKLKHPVTKYQGGRIREWKPGVFMADFCRLGKRERKCFDTIEDAKTYIDQKKIEVKNVGLKAFDIEDRDRVDLSKARKILGDIAILDAAKFYKKHHPDKGKTRTIAALIPLFLDAPGKRGKQDIVRRQATIKGHASRLNAFATKFGKIEAHLVTQEEIAKWIKANKWTGINRKHYVAAIRALFEYAIRQGACRTNPAIDIPTPLDEDSETEPDIMAPEAVQRLLNAAAVEVPDLLPRLLFGFFCGLRPGEVSRLSWDNVNLQSRLITITKATSKTKKARTVDIPSNLSTWLTTIPGRTGKVWPYASQTTLVRKMKAAKEAAGVSVPGNAGRHAFASYHLAAYASQDKTATQMGHRDSDLLNTTYKGLKTIDGKSITKAIARTFWAIKPPAGMKKVLRFQKAS